MNKEANERKMCNRCLNKQAIYYMDKDNPLCAECYHNTPIENKENEKKVFGDW